MPKIFVFLLAGAVGIVFGKLVSKGFAIPSKQVLENNETFGQRTGG